MEADLEPRICQTCGRPHVSASTSEPADIARGIEPIDVHGDAVQFSETHDVDPADLRNSTLMAIGATALVVLAVWGLVTSLNLGSDNNDTSDAAGDVAADVAFEATFSPINQRLGYLSGENVVIVDLQTGTLEKVPIEPVPLDKPVSELALIADGERVVGIDPENTTSADLVAIASNLVPAVEAEIEYWRIHLADSAGMVVVTAWREHPDSLGVGAVSIAGTLLAPAHSHIIAVPELGVLVSPPTGGTFLATVDGFEMVSESSVLAATPTARLEMTCDESLECSHSIVDTQSGSSTSIAAELPAGLMSSGSELSLSPDARWLLVDAAPVQLWNLETGSLREVDAGSGFKRADWSADSSTVTWLDTAGEPALVVAYADGKAPLSISLAGLIATPVVGSGFAPIRVT